MLIPTSSKNQSIKTDRGFFVNKNYGSEPLEEGVGNRNEPYYFVTVPVPRGKTKMGLWMPCPA